ncbi:hypothetical protein HanRHA438_Chr11g0524241 [Helianthus annuus]|nr:hypothetical protein HanIR_Chr11g0550501 [Helianthus annuus]KAJ0872484.1 hypothetical protein HanRHA438_Chr11g0524241 [Helianthus annuus]
MSSLNISTSYSLNRNQPYIFSFLFKKTQIIIFLEFTLTICYFSELQFGISIVGSFF